MASGTRMVQGFLFTLFCVTPL